MNFYQLKFLCECCIPWSSFLLFILCVSYSKNHFVHLLLFQKKNQKISLAVQRPQLPVVFFLGFHKYFKTTGCLIIYPVSMQDKYNTCFYFFLLLLCIKYYKFPSFRWLAIPWLAWYKFHSRDVRRYAMGNSNFSSSFLMFDRVNVTQHAN